MLGLAIRSGRSHVLLVRHSTDSRFTQGDFSGIPSIFVLDRQGFPVWTNREKYFGQTGKFSLDKQGILVWTNIEKQFGQTGKFGLDEQGILFWTNREKQFGQTGNFILNR